MVGVSSESDLERLAYQLNQKKMFFGGVYFNNVSTVSDKEYSYKIRLDIDNIPVTLENRNRFWFPGPNGNFELDMKYHRGFIQLQYALDRAIIRTVRHHESLRLEKERAEMTTIMADYEYSSDNSVESRNSTQETVIVTIPTVATTTTSSSSVPDTESNPESNIKISTITIKTVEGDGHDDSLNYKDDGGPIHDEGSSLRKKRGVLNVFDFDFDDSSEKKPLPTSDDEDFHVDEFEVYTKQFPYPKYKKDIYVTGIYLGQAIQMTFFFGLIVQVTASIRQRIWAKESGNSTVSANVNRRKEVLKSTSVSLFVS